MSVPELHSVSVDQGTKEVRPDEAVGQIQSRDVVVAQTSYYEWFTTAFWNLVGKVIERPPSLEDRVANLTGECIAQLKEASAEQQKVILQWAVKVYNIYGYNLLDFKNGGHMRDMMARNEANRMINPVLLKEIDKLIPHSDKARELKIKAVQEKKDLSYLLLQSD